MLIDLFDENVEDPDNFVSFIVFEPASLRIPDNDLLLVGDQVTKVFNNVINSQEFESNLQDQILINRLKRIEMMIDLLKSTDGLIMTKFLNNIWRRYSFFSNLGELFITQRDIKRLDPSFEIKRSNILERFIEAEEVEDDSSNDDDKSDESKEKSETDSDKKSSESK